MLACFIESRSVRLDRSRREPARCHGSVRVELRVAGICRTDLELAAGYMNFRGVPGHEFVGTALDGELAGRRVVAEINFGCGVCDWCRRDMARHCPERRVLGIEGADGAMAERFLVPERNLIEVADSIDDETAVFVEPVAAACELLEQLESRLPADALVLGDGKLGPLIAQVLASEGVRVDLAGHHTAGLEWLDERGVRLHDRPPEGRRYEFVVDATGRIEGLRQALEHTRPRGVLALKTTVAASHTLDLAPLVIDEITLLGSRCGRFGPALERLADGRVEVAPLVDARYPLEQVEEAFRHAAAPGVRKVLLTRT